jgi:hypothetical protein
MTIVALQTHAFILADVMTSNRQGIIIDRVVVRAVEPGPPSFQAREKAPERGFVTSSASPVDQPILCPIISLPDPVLLAMQIISSISTIGTGWTVDLRFAVTDQGVLNRLDAETRLHRDRYPPGQNAPAEPVDDSGEVDEAARHRNVGEILSANHFRQIEAEQAGKSLPA